MQQSSSMSYLDTYTNRSILITGGLGAHVTLVDSLITDYDGNRFAIRHCFR